MSTQPDRTVSKPRRLDQHCVAPVASPFIERPIPASELQADRMSPRGVLSLLLEESKRVALDQNYTLDCTSRGVVLPSEVTLRVCAGRGEDEIHRIKCFAWGIFAYVEVEVWRLRRFEQWESGEPPAAYVRRKILSLSKADQWRLNWVARRVVGEILAWGLAIWRLEGRLAGRPDALQALDPLSN